MSKITELFKQENYDELWQRCCGFLDLSLDDFMKIQRRLLLEQMEKIARHLSIRLCADAATHLCADDSAAPGPGPPCASA